MRSSCVKCYVRMKNTTRVLLALIVWFGLAPAAAQQQNGFLNVDTVSIRFRLDSIRIDMDFADNARQWETFEKNFREHYAGIPSAALRLDIYAGASPEGTAAHNRWLGEGRGQAIRRLVRQRLGRSVGNIVVHNEGARWDDFYEMVAQSDEPWREEVLNIIDMPASYDENERDQREILLRRLYKGKIWPVLMEKYLSPLRSGASAVLSWQASGPYVGGRDTIVVCDTVFIAGAVPGAPKAGGTDGDALDKRIEKAVKQLRPLEKRPAWILRTNLPLLCAITPNLQAEWSLDHRDHWSINIEGVASWWTFAHNAYANEIIYGSLELRRWLGHRQRHHTLSGFHIGLGVGGGYYDLEWKSKGYQGEVIMAFVNIGWQHRFGKRRQWAFDAGVGLGYLYSPYRFYHGSSIYPESHTEQYDDHLMWRETSHLNWFGAPHANISIGYVFNTRKGFYRRAKAVERDSIRIAYEQQRDVERERLRLQRDSLDMQWYSLSKSERKAAREAYQNKKKELKKKKK